MKKLTLKMIKRVTKRTIGSLTANDPIGVWNGKSFAFTLRKVCQILNINIDDLPKEYHSYLDQTSNDLCYNTVSEKANYSICFDVWPQKSTERKFTKYAETSNIVLISSKSYYSEDKRLLPTIHVEDSLKAYYKIGEYIKACFPIPTIGITGSVGKTTTLMMAEVVFGEKYKVFVSGPGGKNYNIPTAFIDQMVRRYSPVYGIHIQECGGGRSKLVEEAAEILKADAFGITKISKEHHIDHYNGADDLIADKTSFDRHGKKETFGVINLDDEILGTFNFNHKVITYGIERFDADYVGKNIVQNGELLEFDIEGRASTSHFSINIVGNHNVYNALMVYILAKEYGLTDAEIQNGFSKYRSGLIRQAIRNVAGRTLYIDCFNVCSDSIKSCVKTLSDIEPAAGCRRIAVLGGENALGEFSDEINYRTGTELTGDGIDQFIFVSPSEPSTDHILNRLGNGKALYNGAKTVIEEGKILYYDDLDDLAEYLSEKTTPGDVILFKGIFRLPLFAAIDMAFGTNYLIYNVNFKGKSTKDEHYFGTYYDEINGINLIKQLEKELYLPDSINGKAVVRIGAKVYANRTKLEKVVIGNRCKTIGQECFSNCVNIKTVLIPPSMIFIEKRAFKACRSIGTLDLRNLKHIEEEAFKGCKLLKKVILGNECGVIEKDAFNECPNLTIHAPKGSYAERYAMENEIKFTCTDDSVML